MLLDDNPAKSREDVLKQVTRDDDKNVENAGSHAFSGNTTVHNSYKSKKPKRPRRSSGKRKGKVKKDDETPQETNKPKYNFPVYNRNTYTTAVGSKSGSKGKTTAIPSRTSAIFGILPVPHAQT